MVRRALQLSNLLARLQDILESSPLSDAFLNTYTSSRQCANRGRGRKQHEIVRNQQRPVKRKRRGLSPHAIDAINLTGNQSFKTIKLVCGYVWLRPQI